jgi:hypothetical protein
MSKKPSFTTVANPEYLAHLDAIGEKIARREQWHESAESLRRQANGFEEPPDMPAAVVAEMRRRKEAVSVACSEAAVKRAAARKKRAVK